MVLGVSLMCLYIMLWGDLYLSVMGLMMGLFASLLLFSQEVFIELGGLVWGDFVGQSLLCLTLYISCLILLSSMHVDWLAGFNVVVLSISLLLVLTFSVNSFILFYVFFESVLVPTLLLILGWGSQPERLQAVSYMVIYTVMGSLPFLYGLSVLFSGGMSMDISCLYSWVTNSELAFSWLFVLAFLVNLPVYPFHLWLPNAHVEAPVAGSIALAGLLLKLGGYGLLRFSSVVVFPVIDYSMIIVISVVLVGGVLTSFICLRQVDLNAMVAYSSVGHISLVFLGVISNSVVGVMGALLIMVGHGLCSSGLFVAVDIMANSSGSRLIVLNKGHLMVSPSFSLLCFLLCASNMAAPPTLSYFGEAIIFIVAVTISFWVVLLVGLISFLSACYSLYFYVSTQHGNSSAHISSWSGGSSLSYLVLLLHWLPLNFLFLFML